MANSDIFQSVGAEISTELRRSRTSLLLSPTSTCLSRTTTGTSQVGWPDLLKIKSFLSINERFLESHCLCWLTIESQELKERQPP